MFHASTFDIRSSNRLRVGFRGGRVTRPSENIPLSQAIIAYRLAGRGTQNLRILLWSNCWTGPDSNIDLHSADYTSPCLVRLLPNSRTPLQKQCAKKNERPMCVDRMTEEAMTERETKSSLSPLQCISMRASDDLQLEDPSIVSYKTSTRFSHTVPQ